MRISYFSIANVLLMLLFVTSGCSKNPDRIYQLARAAQKNGQWNKATAYYDQGIDEGESGLWLDMASYRRSYLFLSRAVCAVKINDYVSAAEDAVVAIHYSKMQRDSPGFSIENEYSARLILAIAFQRYHKFDEARLQVDLILEESPEHRGALEALQTLQQHDPSSMD